LTDPLSDLLNEVRACTACAHKLSLDPRPVVQVGVEATILIAGQAPGKKVHQTGIPFDDPSGKTLRHWLGIDRATFYDPEKIPIPPMGFCYPGRGKSGDLPPTTECAPLWRPESKATLTETVRAYRDYLPNVFPLPHPSPRNGPWLKRHPWFDEDVIPALRDAVSNARKASNSGSHEQAR